MKMNVGICVLINLLDLKRALSTAEEYLFDMVFSYTVDSMCA